MSSPYVGEIRMFAGNFAPAGWMLCQGQTLPIAENDVLFQLIGTTYGGDGQQTFNLPDLASRVPVHMGTGADGSTYQIGELNGVESVTLSVAQLPAHTHALQASTDLGSVQPPSNAVLAQSTVAKMYIQDTPDGALANGLVTPVGGSQPHENVQPFLCINFIISLFGIFPSPT